MIVDRLPKEQIREYKRLIQAVSSLSNLFSESSTPYIGYRSAENIFCKAFGAVNLSRSDCSVDAKLNRDGIGIKTFLAPNGRATFQKIAEFNRDSVKFRDCQDEEMVKLIAELRNERINYTKRTYGIDNTYYHCLMRDSEQINISESMMDLIRMDKIHVEGNKKDSTTVKFHDGINDYVFNKSKSTLTMKFDKASVLFEVGVTILEDPYSLIGGAGNTPGWLKEPIEPYLDHAVLPLYSTRKGVHVPEKSGLNQWNASGRKRNFNEVYIPIPSTFYREKPDFFPPRDQPFTLHLPDGKELSVKVCQDGGKALMSNPNSDLGDWILRQVLDTAEGELVTYSLLERLNINSVAVFKNSETDYSIDFTYSDPYSGQYHLDDF
jgi:NgoFVII restriction endonuclease.